MAGGIIACTIQPSLSSSPTSSHSFSAPSSLLHSPPLHLLTRRCFFSSSPRRTTPLTNSYRRILIPPHAQGVDFSNRRLAEERVNLEFDERSSRVHVRYLAERIRTLPSTERIRFLDLLRRDGKMESLSELNDLLMALVLANEPDIALQVFDEMPSQGLVPDSWTLSTMILCHCERGNVNDAKRVLDSMVDSNVVPSVATFTTLVNSFCRKGQMQKAFEVFDVMEGVGCKPTIRTYNCLIKGLCYVGRVEEAFEMLEMIKKASISITPDIYTYTAVMDGFCKVGRSKEARQLLYEVLKMGLTPNVVTFNTLFNGYCKEGKPSKGLGVLKLMKQRDCMPDWISYSTLMHGLLKWGQARAALSVYKEMVVDGFEADERLMNILLRGLCRISWKERDILEDAYQVFDKMKSMGHFIDESTYGLIIRTLSGGNRSEEALLNMDHMTTLGYKVRAVSLEKVLRAVCREGKLDKALSVLADDRYGYLSKLAYNVVINEFNQQGRLFCACNVYGMALKRGVVPDKKPRYQEKYVGWLMSTSWGLDLCRLE